MEKFNAVRRSLHQPKLPNIPYKPMKPKNVKKIANLKASAEYQGLVAKGIAPVTPNFEETTNHMEWQENFTAWKKQVEELALNNVKAEADQPEADQHMKELFKTRVLEVQRSELFKLYCAITYKQNRVKVRSVNVGSWSVLAIEDQIQWWKGEMKKALRTYVGLSKPDPDFQIHPILARIYQLVGPSKPKVKDEPLDPSYEEFEEEIKTEPKEEIKTEQKEEPLVKDEPM